MLSQRELSSILAVALQPVKPPAWQTKKSHYRTDMTTLEKRWWYRIEFTNVMDSSLAAVRGDLTFQHQPQPLRFYPFMVSKTPEVAICMAVPQAPSNDDFIVIET